MSCSCLAAVVFDFDGVLVDTERLHYDAYQAVLAPQGLGFDWAEYADRYMCLGDADAIREAYRSAGRPMGSEELALLVERKGEAFEASLSGADVPVFDGALELLAELRTGGLPCGLCSAASRRDIDLILGALGLNGRFDVVVSADDVTVGKPDPACYRLAVKALADRFPDAAVAPATAVAIEDTPGGVQAARGAGLAVLAVGTTHQREELIDANWFVDRLTAVSLSDLRRRFDAERR